jgi:hypothetical protein
MEVPRNLAGERMISKVPGRSRAPARPHGRHDMTETQSPAARIDAGKTPLIRAAGDRKGRKGMVNGQDGSGPDGNGEPGG